MKEGGGKNTPMIVACQWNMSSPTGPAEHYTYRDEQIKVNEKN